MTSRLDPDDWRAIERRIRGVLKAHWDPIGVANLVDDEYDSYIGGIYALINRSASDEDVARHLQALETGAMGLHGTSLERLVRVAVELRRAVMPPRPERRH